MASLLVLREDVKLYAHSDRLRLDNAASWQPAKHVALLAKVIQLTGQVCRIDLTGQPDVASRRGHSFDRHCQRAHRMVAWSRLLLVLISLILVRLLVNIYYQYDLDFKLLRLNRLIETHSAELTQVKPNSSTALLWTQRASDDLDQAPNEFKKLLKDDLLQHDNCTTNSSDCEKFQSVLLNLERSSEQVAQAEARLARWGAPFRRAHFACQVFYLTIIGAVFQEYFLNQFYINYVQPLDISLLKLILDRRQVQTSLDATILRECRNYLQSDKNFLNTFLAPAPELTGNNVSSSANTQTGPRPRCKSVVFSQELRPFFSQASGGRQSENSGAATRANYGKPLQGRRIVADQLRRMMFNGELQPENRRCAWIERILLFYSLMLLPSLAGACLIGAMLLASLSFLMDTNMHWGLMDKLTMGEMLVASLLGIIAGNFYNSMVLLTCLDQIYSVQKMEENLAQCLRANQRKFAEIEQLLGEQAEQFEFGISAPLACGPRRRLSSLPRGSAGRVDGSRNLAIDHQIELLAAQMNYNLLLAFIKYRLFDSQLRPVIQSYEYFSLQLVFLIMYCPFFAILHVPYTPRYFHWIVFLASFGIVMLADVCLLPICHLHRRCMRLSRPLSSLLAHAIEVMRALECPNNCIYGRQLQVYDQHLIWLLYRELQYPGKILERFASKSWGLRFTFTSLLKVHFWFSLIALTLIVSFDAKPNAQRDIFVELVHDPLGVFR